ncbi:Site-specific recombinase XerD [Paraburkholderia caribensis]|uniref:tyrosine-type recombinase/integrase n=1 Tax=Paraburkholderia caribensis TaxID=75105 RepID=UPI001CAFC91B|nr:integrase family protein [Paraburkholderia caribensis]CAG9195944.1 Site-specific recombinase XerD [Paraburkholderia caribensis]
MANITKTYVERSAVPRDDGKPAFYFDDEIKGFGIRATSGAKTFIVDRKLNGKTIRVSIGRYPAWSVQAARDRAKELIVELDKGNDVRQQEKRRSDAAVTLQTAFEKFMSERPLKPRTQLDYRRYMEHYLSDWLGKAIANIDSDMIMARYRNIAKSSSGAAQASSVMRTLRSVFNFAIATYGRAVIPENPVASLTAKRAWLRDKARTDHLRPHEIKPFVLAARALPNAVMGAYIEFVLLTGARRSEAATLKWKHVDRKARTLTLKETKNHTDRILPITPRVAEILDAMWHVKIGEFVFAARDKDNKASHITEPRKAMTTLNTAAGSTVTVHGLRRTFSTVLESLDCPGIPLKSLLGHSLKGDVTTAHYTQITVERLRPWAERYEQNMLALIAAKEPDENFTASAAPAGAEDLKNANPISGGR